MDSKLWERTRTEAGYGLLNFGARVLAARRAKRLTQHEVARAFGVDRAAISQWETKGLKRVGEERINQAIDLFGGTAEWWVSGEGSPPPYITASPTMRRKDATVKPFLIEPTVLLGVLVHVATNYEIGELDPEEFARDVLALCRFVQRSGDGALTKDLSDLAFGK